MLGYIEKLSQSESSIHICLQNAEREVQSTREQLQMPMHSAAEKDKLLQFSQSKMQSRERLAQENHEALLVNSSLLDEVKQLKLQNENLMSCISELNGRVEQESEERLQLEINMWIKIESLNESHEKRLSKIVSNLRALVPH